jgi:putative transposase
MLRGIKIRIYLSNEQEIKINSLMGSYRFVYNQSLSLKKESYEKDKINISLNQLTHNFHNNLRVNNVWLKEHNTKVIKSSLICLDNAYTNFFKHKKGYPKFKSKHDNQNIQFPREAISKNTFTNGKLNLTTDFKNIKFECSERDKNYLYINKEKIRSILLSKTKTGKYFGSVLIDGELLKEVKENNNLVAFDLGIKTLLTSSNGEIIENPKWIRENEKKLKRKQKQLSKKQKGSKNRNKERLKLARIYEKINNKKNNFIHNLTTNIINENQVIIMEDLNVKGMMKNHNLAKSIQELGLGEIKRQLEYKSKWYGRELIFVDRFFPSSKLCSCCGTKNTKLTLKDREWECLSCGTIHNRDYNASVNILNEGIRLYKDKNREALAQIYA